MAKRGSQATTTVSATISSPSAVRTPRTRSPSTSSELTAVSVRVVPPAASKLARTASVSAPLPPTGRPPWVRCMVARRNAPRPVPFRWGDTPHTAGPEAMLAPSRVSELKKPRSTWATDRRDHHSRRAAPVPRRRATEEATAPGVGDDSTTSRTRRATGRAALR